MEVNLHRLDQRLEVCNEVVVFADVASANDVIVIVEIVGGLRFERLSERLVAES